MARCWFVLLALAGCSQILGVKDITLGDAGSGSGHPDAMQHCVTANTVTPASSKLFIACLDTLPTAPVTLSGTIDTDTYANCITGKQVNSGPDVCMIAGMKITISSPVGAKGSRPLVLVALTDIDVSSQIDIRGDQVSAGMLVQAPGANTGCGAPSPGGDSATSPGGGGGGAFGGSSGAGGQGSSGAIGGSGGSTLALTFIHGGCDGAAGGNNGSVAGGAAGTGGGALYMIASNSIEIESGATILAGGGGGRGGLAGASGGGGGASGGLVGFDSPSVGLDGTIIANGGGGGGGGVIAIAGSDGQTGTFGSAAGGNGGGAAAGGGGVGGVGPTASTSGVAASAGGGAGGGGGGSIGVIWNDSQFSTVNGNGVSPDPIGP